MTDETKPVPYDTPEVQAERDVMNATWNLMRQLADTEWGAPFGHRPEKMLAAALQGRSLGVDAMTSLREISVIGGRPYISAALQLALVRRAGHQLTGDAYPDKATVTGKRGDTGEEYTLTYSIEDAVSEGLVDLDAEGKPLARSKEGRPLPWERYTQSMLWARAVTRMCDRLFSDVTIGRA